MSNVGYAALQVIPSMRGIDEMLRRQLVAPTERAGDQAGEAAGASLSDKIKLGAAAAGAAAGALLVAGIGKAMERANISSTLQAQLGTSNKVAASQGKVAGKLYSSGVSGSFQEAADAIKSVVQAGLAPPGTTTKQLQAIATKASDVATVFDQDLGGVTNAVSQMMRTGLAKSSTEAFDLITRGFQGGADKAGDFLDTINEYGVQFQKAGLTGSTAIGLLNQAIKAGARDSDLAADAIKEFGIRAVDGSTTTAQGFKMLGLNADDMAKKFAQGGTAANSVLDLTLDRLRGIKDPVKQAQAATALFGTQAEDLGKSLFAMDPSKAAKALGNFGGAADRVGKTIRSGPSHEIEVFKRALESGFVNFLGGKVLPVITDMATWFNTFLLPPIRTVGSAVGSVLTPALSGLWQAGSAVVGWLKDMGTWLVPIGIAIGGLAIAMNTSAIATGITTAVFSVYRAAILVGTAVTNGFAGAQALLNAVMNANPIVLIVTLLIALGAALVIAYQKSETFRSIVQAAWQGIQTAAMWAWNNVLKPVFNGIATAAKAVGTAAMWLWTNVISPVFSFIGAAAKILFTIVAVAVLLPIIAVIKAVGAVASWLWTNAIKPAFNGIAAVASWLWTNVIKPRFDAFKRAFKLVGDAAKWLWMNAIKPSFGWIADKAIWLWNNGIKPSFDLLKRGVQAVGDKARWLWNNGIRPVFGWIGDKAKWLWDKALKPAFDFMKKGVKAVGKSFEDAKNFIKKAWDKVQGIAKKPVRFIINTIYNGGIVPVWNKIATAFGAPKIKKMDISGWATGGVLPGYTPGRDVHKFYSPSGMGLELSGGEAIMRPEFTRGAGAGFVNYFNRIAKSSGAAGVRRALAPALGGNPRTATDRSLRYAGGGVVQRFADGGIFSWIGKTLSGAGSAAWNAIKKGASWLKDTLEGSMRAGVKHVVDPLLKNFPGADTRLGQMIRRIPTRILDAIFGYSKKADAKGAGGIGGPRIQAALRWAKTQNGKPYQWGGNGNPSWDCSGFMSAIESVIRGQKPHRRWATMAFSGKTAPPGWVYHGNSPFKIGITNAGVGHTAGTLGRTNVESRGGDGVIVGRRARGYKSSLFTSWYGFRPGKYDDGGVLPQGYSAVYNGTRQPEAVLTGRQWQAIHSAARGGDGGRGDTYNFYPRTLDMTVRDLEVLQRRQEARARVGRPR